MLSGLFHVPNEGDAMGESLLGNCDMTDIDAIKSNLDYHDDESRVAAYDSWFTVIGVLADSYSDAGMSKEEAICRWLFRRGKRPKMGTIRNPSSIIYYFRWEYFSFGNDADSVLPFMEIESNRIEILLISYWLDLIGCLENLLAIPDEYLDRFQ